MNHRVFYTKYVNTRENVRVVSDDDNKQLEELSLQTESQLNTYMKQNYSLHHTIEMITEYALNPEYPETIFLALHQRINDGHVTEYDVRDLIEYFSTEEHNKRYAYVKKHHGTMLTDDVKTNWNEEHLAMIVFIDDNQQVHPKWIRVGPKTLIIHRNEVNVLEGEQFDVDFQWRRCCLEINSPNYIFIGEKEYDAISEQVEALKNKFLNKGVQNTISEAKTFLDRFGTVAVAAAANRFDQMKQ